MLDADSIRTHVDNIGRDGYTVLERVIEAELVQSLSADLLRLETELDAKPALNSFEGTQTIRIYNLLVHGPLYERIPIHDHVLPIVERVLDGGCLISSLSSIAILPGEVPQPLHADDQLIPLKRPHEPLVCNTIWALTDFTDHNGATRLVPGSHRDEKAPKYGVQYETIPAVMPAGSVLVYNGSIWHGGGANGTGERRVGIAMNYCAGFIRQQENQQLGIPRKLARTFPRRLRELLGYDTYHGIIGHIERKHPGKMLEDGLLD